MNELQKDTNSVKLSAKFDVRILLFVLLLVLIVFNNYIYFALSSFLLSRDIVINNTDLKVHFIDVGQGDAIAINLPDGKVMLIDAGPATAIDDLKEYLNTYVLFDKEDKVIDYFVMTHSDSDHVGGAAMIFDEYEVLNVYRPNIYCSLDADYYSSGVSTSTTQTYYNAIMGMNNENANIFYSSSEIDLSTDDYILNFLSPMSSYYSNANDYSPFIYLDNGITSFLFTGDAEDDAENELIESGVNIDVDVLKVGHHGSDTSTSAELLDATTPIYAVISVGTNSYGHPSDELLARLYDAGIDDENILVTLYSGNIMYVSGDFYGEMIFEGDYQMIFYFRSEYLLVFFAVCDIILLIKMIFKRKRE